jgi:hypothetical protein
MSYIIFDELHQNGLSRQRWWFYHKNDQLTFDMYQEDTRSTKRGKFIPSRYCSNSGTSRSSMEKTDVPFNLAVAALAKAAYLDQIKENINNNAKEIQVIF